MTDAVQTYQNAVQRHREAEIKIAKAKAQAEIYQKDISAILASEEVRTVEELAAKYQEELKKLEAITSVLNKETEACDAVLQKLGVS